MQKQKENVFLDKFRLLNSQEHDEEIIWSPSDSSEYEEPAVHEKFHNIINKTRILKRKRKNKVPKNTSNLSITVLDSSKDNKEVPGVETSPIIVCKKRETSIHKSPILAPTLSCRHLFNSPVLPSKSSHQTSPVLVMKSDSPRPTGKVKKKLFIPQNCAKGPSLIDNNANSNVLNNVKTEIYSDYAIEDDNLTCSSVSEPLVRGKAKIDRVKSFFDSHFSSVSSSQNSQSISDIQTQKDSAKTSDEIEIISCKTQTSSNNNISIDTIKPEMSNHSSESFYYAFNKSKKIRYKKDGLSHRLNNLIRNQNACVSLWQHERFLAANSNFVVPKGENSVFRIQKVDLKYGCYLLETIDLSEDDYLIIINSCYVSDNIVSDTIINVYEPYKVVQYNTNKKMLINVCRFECSHYRK